MGIPGTRHAAKATIGWWYRATDDQRLAQVDGGIECGMTAAEIALASGANVHSVSDFAISRGRSFIRRKSSSGSQRAARKRSAGAAYLRGEPVDFWVDKPGIPRSGSPLLDEIRH